MQATRPAKMVAIGVVLALSGCASNDAEAEPPPPRRATCEEYCAAVYLTPCFVPATEGKCVQDCAGEEVETCADELALFRGCVAELGPVECGVNQFPHFVDCDREAAALDRCRGVCTDCL